MNNKPLRILDLRDSPWVDGPGRTILQSASMVDPDRCEIIIGAFCGETHGEHAYIKDAESRELQVLPIHEKSAFDRQVIKQILRAIKEHSIDILHTHDFRSDMFGLMCSKIAHIPVVSTCHGWIANSFKGKLYTSIDKFSLRFFDRIIAVSQTMHGQLRALGVKQNNISVIRNALIIDNYKPDRSKQSFREELGFNESVKLIVNIGRLSPEKGQDIFIEAAKELSSFKDIKFILIGVGPEQARLEQMIDHYGIADNVIFTGYRSDMLNIYNSVDLVVQSSYTEGMPNVILESLLMQVPVVATSVGGTAEVVEDNVTGLLIESHNLEQLTDGIRHFIDNPDYHSGMAAKGREFISKNFDHNLRVHRLMDVYDDVIQNKSGYQ